MLACSLIGKNLNAALSKIYEVKVMANASLIENCKEFNKSSKVSFQENFQYFDSGKLDEATYKMLFFLLKKS